MKYTFTISFLGATRQVYPLGDFTISLSKEDDQVFLRKLLNSDFEFTDRKEGDDFTYFYDIDQSCDRCEPMILTIACKGSTIAQGTVNLNKAKFEKPIATLQVEPLDAYSDVLRNWETQYNILGAQNTMVSTLGSIGELQTVVCNASVFLFPTSPVDCGDGNGNTLPSVGYVDYKHDIVATGAGNFNLETTWARVFVAGAVQPPGIGWIAVTGGFARPVKLGQDNLSTLPTVQSFEYAILDFTQDGTVREFDNGVPLPLALDRVQAPPVISNFFGINPDATNPNNTVYTQAQADLWGIVLYQVSDIYNADADQNATKALLSLKEILDWLRSKEVYWWMDGGTMRIEHISYLNRSVILDATGESNGHYDYDADFPNVEKFTRQNQESLAFQMPNIIYNKCSDEGSEDTTDTPRLYTDLQWVIDNRDNLNKDSFFMMATFELDSKLYITEAAIDVPFRGIEVRLNGALSWLNLLEHYIKYNRPQKTARTATETLTFETTRRNKIESDISVKMCCEDFINFDGEGLVTTQIGDGEIISGEWDSRSEYLTIELAHDQNC